MTSEEIKILAEKATKNDPNTAIVLYALSASKDIGLDGNLAVYVQEFAKRAVYEMQVGNLDNHILDQTE